MISSTQACMLYLVILLAVAGSIFQNQELIGLALKDLGIRVSDTVLELPTNFEEDCPSLMNPSTPEC